MEVELQVGVKVLLRNAEGKYLLIRRSTDKYQEVQHTWDIPGGRIDSSTELLSNLKREIDEETGLQMMTTPELVGAQDIFNTEQNRHIVRLTYVGNAEGEPRLSEEHTEYKWVSFGELSTLENLDTYLKQLIGSGVISEATHG